MLHQRDCFLESCLLEHFCLGSCLLEHFCLGFCFLGPYVRDRCYCGLFPRDVELAVEQRACVRPQRPSAAAVELEGDAQKSHQNNSSGIARQIEVQYLVPVVAPRSNPTMVIASRPQVDVVDVGIGMDASDGPETRV